MAFLSLKLPLNSAFTETGQTLAQSPHPVHLSKLTKRGALVNLTLNFPGSPSTDSTVRSVLISTLGWRPTSTSFGDNIQAEQSFVGKVLSSCAMTPPMLIPFSTRYTFIPELAKSRDA